MRLRSLALPLFLLAVGLAAGAVRAEPPITDLTPADLDIRVAGRKGSVHMAPLSVIHALEE